MQQHCLNKDTPPSDVKANVLSDARPLLIPENAPNYASINKSANGQLMREQSKSKLTGQSSLTGVTFNLINALVGAGILAVPISYAKCGIFGGIGLMIIFAVICTYTLNLLIYCGQIMDVVNYEDLGYECYGYLGYIGVSLSLFLLEYGVMLTCLIVIADSAQHIISIWGYSSNYDRQISTVILSLMVILPLCLRRDVSHLEIFSFFKLIALLLVTLVIIYECINYYDYSNLFLSQQDIIWFNMNGIPFALGIFAFSFVCHDTAFLYYNSLKNPTIIRYTRLSFGGIGSAMFITSILSIPAYLTFTNDVQGNILNNYEVKGILVIIVRITYIFVMALSYPIPLFVARHICYAVYMRWKYRDKSKSQMLHNFEEVINRNVKNAPLLHHILFSSIIFFSTLSISLFVDNLGVAMSVIGSISSVNLAFVFPSIFYIKVSKHKWIFWKRNTLRDAVISFFALYPPLVLSIFGGIIGIYSAIITIVHSDSGS